MVGNSLLPLLVKYYMGNVIRQAAESLAWPNAGSHTYFPGGSHTQFLSSSHTQLPVIDTPTFKLVLTLSFQLVFPQGS